MKAGEYLPGASIFEAIAGADVRAGMLVRLSGIRVYPAEISCIGVAAQDAREDEPLRVVISGTVAVRTCEGAREFTGSPRWANSVVVNGVPRQRPHGRKLQFGSFADVATEPGTVAVCLSAKLRP